MQSSGEVLFVYGFDPSLMLKPGQIVVFLEDEGYEFSPHVSHRIVVLSKHQSDEMLKQLVWEHLFLPFHYHATREDKQQVLSRLAFYEMGIHLLAADFKDFGFLVLRNIVQNFSQLSQSKDGTKLFGAFKGLPAVVCGAGPSLQEDLHTLKELQDDVVILSGGSALNVLKQGGIVPHFTAAIDPDPPADRQSGQTGFYAPFFYPWRVSEKLLRAVKGPLIWVPSASHHPLEKWLMEKADLGERSFDGGWNVGTFCLALAVALGCRPIYLAGMDLAFTGGEVYAEGVKEGLEREGAIRVRGADGKEIETRKDWWMAASWIDEFAEAHGAVELVNATGGGLGFRNLPKKRLREIPRSGQKVVELVRISVDEIQKIQAGNPRLILREMEESWRRCQKWCKALLASFKKYFPESPFEKGDYALAEVELSGEPAFLTILEPVWNIWRRLFERQIPEPLGRKLNQILFFDRMLKEGEDLWK